MRQLIDRTNLLGFSTSPDIMQQANRERRYGEASFFFPPLSSFPLSLPSQVMNLSPRQFLARLGIPGVFLVGSHLSKNTFLPSSSSFLPYSFPHTTHPYLQSFTANFSSIFHLRLLLHQLTIPRFISNIFCRVPISKPT